MRKIIYFLLVPVFVFGQQLNYTKATTYKIPTTASIPNPAANAASQDIIYLDGFGRPIQQIAHQQSGEGNDLLVPIHYDALGRETREYLPYANSAPSLNYNSNIVTDQGNYAQYVGQYPYSETVYEKSSLGRVLQKSAPGVDWTLGSGHEMRYEYKNNSDNDQVKLFIATASWNDPQAIYDIALSQSVYYDANTLHRKIIKNENWSSGTDNTTEEFTDKRGHLILKREYNGLQTLDTYYVYDQFGNLTYVIPPKADATIDATILNNLCYQYKYDNRNRLVEKKLPGKNWEYIVYDKLDRVVMTGPTNPPFSDLNNNGWIIKKYDVFNRLIMTGWMTSSSPITSTIRYNRQVDRNNATNLSETKLTGGATTAAGTGNANNPAYSYSNVVLPTASYYVLKVNYYDDYDYVNPPTIPSVVETQPVYYNTTRKPIGLPTGEWIKVIDKSTTTVNKRQLKFTLYDYKSRPIKSFARNHQTSGGSPGGLTEIDIKLDFEGKVEHTVTLNKRIDSDSGVKTTDFFTYSDQSRLIDHTHQIGTGTIQLLSSNTYNSMGQLTSKLVGNSISSPLQNINYSYNIRNWLTDINNVNNLVQSGDPNDLFAFRISYNDVQYDLNSPIISEQFNGKISETYWRTASDNQLRKYGYKYDKLGRILHAYYRLPHYYNPSVKSYDEGATYDKNGNIVSLHRNGDVDAGPLPIEIDELAYTYEADSNKLLKVTESTPTQTSGFKDGVNTGDDYSYDDYGNLTKDENKGIVNGAAKAIIYNHLNLPVKIIFGSAGTVEYIYNADGNKIEKTVTQGSTITTTKYFDGYQYVNDVLQFFPTQEGYVSKVGSAYKYVYQYKDHLGNIRLSYVKNATTGNLDIIEENNYYPFGLTHSGYNSTLVAGGNTEAQKYKFGQKEFQKELDLNLYDFGARNYDPAIGRWMNIDPLAETSKNISPYTYALNDPIYYVDPDGMDEEDFGEWGVDATDINFGWIENASGHGVRYDPNVHSQKDLEDQGKTGTYICEECLYTGGNALMTLYDREATEGTHDNWIYGDHLSEKGTNEISDQIIENVGEIDLDIDFVQNSMQMEDDQHTQDELQDLLEALQEHRKVKIEIIGNVYVDDKNANPNTEIWIDRRGGTVKELQRLRAESVKRFLIDNGIDPRRLRIGPGKLNTSVSASIKVIK